MNSAFLFAIAVVIFGIVSTLIALGGPKKAIKFLKENKKVAKGIFMFTGFGLLIALSSVAFGEEKNDGLIHETPIIVEHKPLDLTYVPAKKFEPKGKWFAYGEVYLGLDVTKDLSPQCVEGDNDRLTSNGGVKINIYQSADKRFEANSKYTHHSCAFAEDREVSDGFGLEFSYKFFQR